VTNNQYTFSPNMSYTYHRLIFPEIANFLQNSTSYQETIEVTCWLNSKNGKYCILWP